MEKWPGFAALCLVDKVLIQTMRSKAGVSFSFLRIIRLNFNDGIVTMR
ncbi:MAG TPA: hypothetical protein VI758_04545 [Bacteroidota bacterium]